MNPLLDSEAALEKLLAFVKSLSPAKKEKTEAGWADRLVGAMLNKVGKERCFITHIVVAELLFGAYRSKQVEEK